MDIKIADLSKNYKKVKALDDVNLEIGSGMFGLLGPNGAGKTTLIRIVSTLLLPFRGEVSVGPYSIYEDQQRIRKVLGYLPQSFAPYPQLTVQEFLEYMAYLAGVSNVQERVNKCLEMVSLTDERKTRSSRLSGGMKRRLGIAQALINDPQLLVVDEPTAGLDPIERVKFRNLLASLSPSRTVILSTHILEDVANTCSDLAILHKGRIRYRGSPQDLALEARNRIWELDATEELKAELEKSGAAVTSAVFDDGIWKLRVISKVSPADGAVQAVPSIEDGYMDAMHGRGW